MQVCAGRPPGLKDLAGRASRCWLQHYSIEPLSDGFVSAGVGFMLIEVEGLSKYYSLAGNQLHRAVDRVSFSIPQGQVVGLVGESGCGKSTLGKLLVGLTEKTDGGVSYDGELLPSCYGSGDFKRYGPHMQMVFQDPYSTLNPRWTVEQILVEPLLLQGNVASKQRRRRVIEWLNRVSLSAAMLRRFPHELSGGQRQRLGIARALITEPQFVVCDEPVSALDVSVQAQILNLLADLQRSMGLTLLFISHDLAVVRYLADQVLVMQQGKIVERGSVDEVFAQPKHQHTKNLLTARMGIGSKEAIV